MDLSFVGGEQQKLAAHQKVRLNAPKFTRQKQKAKHQNTKKKNTRNTNLKLCLHVNKLAIGKNVKICAQKKKITRVVLVLVLKYFEEKLKETLCNFFIIIV